MWPFHSSFKCTEGTLASKWQKVVMSTARWSRRCYILLVWEDETLELKSHICCQRSLEGKKETVSRRGEAAILSVQAQIQAKSRAVSFDRENEQRLRHNRCMCGCQFRSGGESRRFPSFWLTWPEVHSYIPSLRCESPSLLVILFPVWSSQSDHALIHKAVHKSCWLWLPLYMFINTCY